MANITFTQTPAENTLVLYPTGDDTVDLSKSSGANNYLLVDESWDTSNDTDYVYSVVTDSTTSDLYTVGNHTTETGTISEIELRCRVRGRYDTSTPSFAIKCKLSSTISVSAYKSATKGFSSYTYTLPNKPTGGAWGWTDIDNMKIGANLNASGELQTSTLIPTSDYTTGNTAVDCGVVAGGWCCVDTETPGYLITSGVPAWRDDTFGFNTSNIYGLISTVSVVDKVFGDGSWDYYARTELFTHATQYSGTGNGYYYGRTDNIFLTSNYATNPFTSATWTIDEVKDMHFGVGLKEDAENAACRWSYCEVKHRGETDMSQIYAIVRYVPLASTITLPLPQSLSMSHSRNINRFTFPDGGYEVEDMSRSGKTLSLTGWSNTDLYTKMQGIGDMSHYGSTVSVTGLPDSNLNTDYYIRSFSFNQKGGEVSLYTWSVELEEA